MKIFTDDFGQFINADCLDAMKSIPGGSVDMVLCDLPYGTTDCKWDTIISFEPLWAEYWRIANKNAAIVLTAAFPFTAILCVSQINNFRYSLVWDKVNKYTGALNANRMPMRRHEDILVFYKNPPVYNPQKRKGVKYTSKSSSGLG